MSLGVSIVKFMIEAKVSWNILAISRQNSSVYIFLLILQFENLSNIIFNFFVEYSYFKHYIVPMNWCLTESMSCNMVLCICQSQILIMFPSHFMVTYAFLDFEFCSVVLMSRLTLMWRKVFMWPSSAAFWPKAVMVSF